MFYATRELTSFSTSNSLTVTIMMVLPALLSKLVKLPNLARKSEEMNVRRLNKIDSQKTRHHITALLELEPPCGPVFPRCGGRVALPLSRLASSLSPVDYKLTPHGFLLLVKSCKTLGRCLGRVVGGGLVIILRQVGGGAGKQSYRHKNQHHSRGLWEESILHTP